MPQQQLVYIKCNFASNHLHLPQCSEVEHIKAMYCIDVRFKNSQKKVVYSMAKILLPVKALKPIYTEAALASPGNGGRLYGDYGNSW